MTDFDSTVLELLLEVGTTATYTSVQPGAYNPSTGTVSLTKVDQTVQAALFDLTLQSNGMSLKYGTTIKAGDKEAYMLPPQKTGGQPITVAPGVDKFTIAGVAYTVVTFKEVNPTGSDPCVYFLYLRL